jgi:hypothetical protein
LDAISHALGLEIDEGTFVPVVERGTAIPTIRSVSIALDTSREVQVVEENIHRPRESVSFGRLDLSQFGFAPAERTRLEITFALDVGQNLEVTLESGWRGDRLATTPMAPTGRLTKREIEEARRGLRFREDPESLRTQRLRWLSKLQELRGRVRELYEVWAPALIETERARIETNLVNARRADAAGIDVIREAHRWLTVSLATLETTAFMALPLEERIRIGFPDEFIEDFASSTTEPPEALRALALNPEWTARYGVRYRLVMNPSTPLDVAMRFVDGLWDEDLAEVACSEALAEMLRSHARTILRMRLPPGPSLSS